MSDLRIDDKAVAFISDWEKRSNEQRRKYTKLSIAVTAVAFLLCIFAFLVFQNGNYMRIIEQNMSYVQDSALQEADHVEHELYSAENAVQSLAQRYANLLTFEACDTVLERLDLLRDLAIFDRIAFVNTEGHTISFEGEADVSDRYYFKSGMRGETGWQMLGKSRVTGLSTLIFYSPVVVDGDIVGVMAGFYSRDRLDRLFSYRLFDYTPETFLLMGDGTVIANSGDWYAEGNYLEELSDKKYIGKTDFKDIQSTIESPERTTVTFSFEENRRTSVGVIVQFSNSTWMLMSILPDVTEQMVYRANITGAYMLISIAIIFILTFVSLLLFNSAQKKQLKREMSIAADNLNTTVQGYQKQVSIIQSLTDVYSSVYYIDLMRGSYTRLKEDALPSRDVIDEVGNAGDAFSTYVNSFVDTAYKPALGELLEVSTMRERLQDSGFMSAEYQRADRMWRRATIVPAEVDENGDILSAVFAVQPIDREKEKEHAAQEALQEAYEAAKMANSAKTVFLSNMSHDIRTPMNAIIGMTTIAAAHIEDPEKVSECLKKITSSSKHLLGLINEVLDMSKIESGKVDLSEEEFSLSELIDNLISIHHSLIQEKHHMLRVQVNNLVHEKVIGDSTRLQQVFANLFSNAIKYTPEGGSLEIIITEKDTHKPTTGMYEVVFKDNGIGMTEEYQKTIFEPFSRAKDDRVAQIKGTGLGMPIAKNIIQMMNGDIEVKSTLNEGSTFTVTFALKLQNENDIDYSEFVDLPVLVVDDDPSACESTCTILNDLSMSSEWVTSGEEAVERVAEHHGSDNDYYAVIVDWKMPGMDGLETTRRIRALVGSEVPIIVMSAYDWSDIENEARDAGVNAFLSKPLFKSKLVNLFNELINDEKRETVDVSKDIRSHDFSSKRILLVEDNEINREVATELLGMAGPEIESAENGKISVDMFSASEPGYYDLILMDVQMPVMNGYEATRAIRALDRPDAKTIPIIAMTANAFSSDVQDAFNAGMNGHLAKPIDIQYVLKVLEENLF